MVNLDSLCCYYVGLVLLLYHNLIATYPIIY